MFKKNFEPVFFCFVAEIWIHSAICIQKTLCAYYESGIVLDAIDL